MSLNARIKTDPRPFRLAGFTTKWLTLVGLAALAWIPLAGAQDRAADPAGEEARFLTGTRQLTFEGRRAGEGYFGADGKKLVFQSEREAENPFYQIYLMDLETGDVDRVSPGHGKTTCAWIHPRSGEVLFASTHDDPQAVEKQKQEIELRQSGQQRRYAWDYDEHYQIYAWNPKTRRYKQLTDARGYDAEGNYSPDGTQIVFASNRRAFERGAMDEELAKHFQLDPSLMMDLYIMNADGTDVRQLTTELGYDGGPFFSPDGSRICWRRFSEDGLVAEVWTMNTDGSDKKQLTRIGHMSWAPFYHPSGEYLIFTTNKQGFSNFELYLVDAQGSVDPVRVTFTDGFDGLASFSPDGTQLVWTSNRNTAADSQLFIANWNHDAARAALGLQTDLAGADVEGRLAWEQTSALFRPQDVLRHVDYLCREELEGRMTGSRGERMATGYVASYLDTLGLQPAGDVDPQTGKPGWFQEFPFPAGARLGEGNQLRAAGAAPLTIDRDWRPLAFSESGAFDAAPVVFAGYGIVAPQEDDQSEYDSFVHLDVQDKWVLVFRYLPEDIAAQQRQHLQFHSSLRHKAMVARDKGARGLIVVSGPASKVKEQLVPLQTDSSLAGTSIAVISIADDVAQNWLDASGKSLEALQTQLDSGEPMMGFEIPGLLVEATLDVQQMTGTGRNVIGRLAAGENPTEQAIVVGAHVDHLGRGRSSSSLAREEEQGRIHFGADDNASGVAAMLEIAEYLADAQHNGKLQLKRDVIFAAWSGEELNLWGSKRFVEQLAAQLPAAGAGETGEHGDASAAGGPGSSIYPRIAAYLNMDMVGRFDKNLILQGLGSSDYWTGEIERRNAVVGLPLKLSADTNLPTDARTFYAAGVPILSAFTGSHSDYHTPRDTPDKLDYDRASQVAQLMGLVARSLATSEQIPSYVEHTAEAAQQPRANMRAYLGTAPDYAGDIKGVLLSGVTRGSPADQAGLQAGDVIVELAGRKIENIYDYTYAIEGLKIGTPVKIVVMRDGKQIESQVVPASRD